MSLSAIELVDAMEFRDELELQNFLLLGLSNILDLPLFLIMNSDLISKEIT